MEFYEKELRKSRGLTQEELAEALFVSRTAVSKWESAKGYPSIDSLKAISSYFSVTIDDLLSAEKLIIIAEKENRSNIQSVCNWLFGLADIFTFMLIFLPLYPKTVGGYIYSVNLLNYTEASELNLCVYWAVFLLLIAAGAWKLVLSQLKLVKGQRYVTIGSMVLSAVSVLFLALAGEPYAVTVLFLLLIFKGILLFKAVRSSI